MCRVLRIQRGGYYAWKTKVSTAVPAYIASHVREVFDVGWADQGSQFGSDDLNRWCKDNRLVPSTSRRGNCWDNAVAESFFGSLKKERIKRRIYPTRDNARSDVFDSIEGFYNRVRRHSHLDQLSPVDFEQLRIGS